MGKSAIEEANKCDVPQKKRLWKALNKERKAKHEQQVEIRDRLRDIRERHMERFLENVRIQNEAQQELKQSQQQQQMLAKQKQQKAKQLAKQQQQKKAKQKKSPSPSPSNNTARKPGKKKKYTPPRDDNARDAPNNSESDGSAPQTFAEKMRARRKGADGGGSSFADRFGLGQRKDGGSRGGRFG